MNLAMMSAAQGDSELVADLTTERPALGKAQVMGIARLAAADQARSDHESGGRQFESLRTLQCAVLHDIVAGRRKIPSSNSSRPQVNLHVHRLDRKLIRKPQDKRQSYSEPSHVLAAETPDLMSYPFASDGDWFIGHHLRFEPQSIFGPRLNGDAKIRSVHQFGSQLADHHRSMILREGVGLHDDRRTRLAIVTGRGNGHQITASHLHQTRKPIRSISKRRVRDPDRGRRLALLLVVALPASGGRQPRGATRADPVCVAAAASSSSSRPLPPWTLPTCNALQRNALQVGRQGRPSRQSLGQYWPHTSRRLISSVTRPSCTMRLPDKSSGSTPRAFPATAAPGQPHRSP